MNLREQGEELLKKYPCPQDDPLKTEGVLLSDEIEYHARNYKMLDPFDPSNLKPAGYELTLGEDYAIGGKLGKLSLGKDELEIPPFEVAIISTKETINLPRFIIARWNLRVKWIYEGLLWTGALQVDPGWVGPLYCPIYNLSSEPVRIKLGEPIVLMDFVKTTPFNEKSKKYGRPPKRRDLKDYNWKLKSALFTQAAHRIDEVEKKVSRVESIVGLVLTCIAILFAALSIIVTSAKTLSITYPIWFIISVSLSIVAIAISLFSRVKLDKDRWFNILVTTYIIISAIVIAFLCVKVW